MSHSFFASKMGWIVEDMGPAVSVLDSLSMLLVLIFWIPVAFSSHSCPNVYTTKSGSSSFSKNPSSKFKWQALTMLATSMPTNSTGFPSNHQYQQFRRSLWAAIGRIAPGRQEQGHVIGGPYMPRWNEYCIGTTDGFGYPLHWICPIKMGFKICWNADAPDT